MHSAILLCTRSTYNYCYGRLNLANLNKVHKKSLSVSSLKKVRISCIPIHFYLMLTFSFRSNLMRRSATLPELGSPSHTIRDSKLGLGHESFPRNHLGNRASFALAQPDKVNSPQIMVSELRHNVQV